MRWVAAIVASLACVALASLGDVWTYHHVSLPRVYDTDWGRALRTMGYWPLWAIVAFAIWRHGEGSGQQPDRRARSRWQAAWLVGAVTVAGIAAELLKLLIRRERPGADSGLYVFRAWTDRPFSTSGFGMPSSHAVEAFAAATVLAGCFPETAVVWYGLAIGCAVTRLLSGAHFLSDVVAGAALGLLVAHALRRAFRPGAS
jgi:membrane-associated phospholipid phosphatase